MPHLSFRGFSTYSLLGKHRIICLIWVHFYLFIRYCTFSCTTASLWSSSRLNRLSSIPRDLEGKREQEDYCHAELITFSKHLLVTKGFSIFFGLKHPSGFIIHICLTWLLGSVLLVAAAGGLQQGQISLHRKVAPDRLAGWSVMLHLRCRSQSGGVWRLDVWCPCRWFPLPARNTSVTFIYIKKEGKNESKRLGGVYCGQSNLGWHFWMKLFTSLLYSCSNSDRVWSPFFLTLSSVYGRMSGWT